MTYLGGTQSFINGYVNHQIVTNMERKKEGAKHIPTKDKALLEEIKRIKRLQKGLYQEYEIPELEIEEDKD